MKSLNRLFGALVALFLIAVGVLTAVEVVSAQISHDPVWIHWHAWDHRLRNTAWSDIHSLLIAILAIAVVLLILELLPRRPHVLPVADDRGVKISVRRRFLERDLGTVARNVDGIQTAKASISKRRLTVDASSNRRDPQGLRAAVSKAVDAELDRFALAEKPPVSVRIHQQR